MTAESSPLRPRRRYDAVYRSAERLIASRPAPAPGRGPARWLVFLLGLACGLAVAVLWLRPVGPTTIGLVPPREAPKTVSRDRRDLNLKAIAVKPQPSAPTQAVKSTPAPANTGPAPVVAAPSVATAPRMSPGVVTRGTTPTRASGTPMTPAVILSRFTTAFKLRGELRATNGTKSNVEFDLQLLPGRLGGGVLGFVRFLDGPPPGESISLVGAWINRTLTLHETMQASTGPRERPDGRVFVVEFPETERADNLTGYWTYHGLRGTLTLKPALPL